MMYNVNIELYEVICVKKVLYVLFAVCLALLVSVSAAAYTKVYIDKSEVQFNDSTGYPFVENGRTLVPLRVTMESFGATVDWEQQTKTSYVRYGTTTVRCVIGESCIYRNNVRVVNDAAAVISGGRTYLPIRAVLEAFGATVGWDGSVQVESGSGAAFVKMVMDTPSVTTNFWAKWTEALGYKEQGDYQRAAETILSISNAFIKANDSSSNAMLFKHLGECYANLGDFEKASACFKREALYWEETPGMEQSVIDANRRSKLISSDIQVYVKNYDKTMGASIHFGVKYEPESGILLGSYAEGDPNLHNPWDPDKFYMDTFPKLVEKEMAAYLIYLSYGSDIALYQSHIDKAKQKAELVQVSLQPHEGLHVVREDDPYLIELAKHMENENCPMILRFAGEMNDETSSWYSKDPSVFIEKFRIVASVFHKYAPSVAIVWSPNFYPEENIDAYYPGDEYVDYVGVSSYKEYSSVTDPLGMGVDRSRWSNQLDRLYSTYGHKKPIVISEGNVSYSDYYTGEDRTEFACSQMKDFYTYLPIKYPNVKMNFIFASDDPPRKFSLTTSEKILETYKNAIKADEYISSINDTGFDHDYYEIGNNVAVKAEITELCSYVTTPLNDVAYVIYSIDGTQAGVSYGVPYSVPVDLSAFKGQKVKVRTTAYNIQDKPVASTEIIINVI